MGKKTVDARGYPLVKVLCLDEITLHKGRSNYLLVISAPELGIVLDVLPDRNKETLEEWFRQRGRAWCAHVETCCADMWDAYHAAAKEYLPNAVQVVDRFHVMKNLNDALSKARRCIQNKADEATKECLKGCRWLLLKNSEKLSNEEREKLTVMFSASPELKACYEYKEEFRRIFNHITDRRTAEVALWSWILRVEASGLKSFQAFAKTLFNWWERILNYFDGRHSNGFAEGVNLKIKMINRRGFGYRNFQHFRLHVLVAFDVDSRQIR
jgi:transposase